MRIKEINISSNGAQDLDIMELPKNCVIVIGNSIVKLNGLRTLGESGGKFTMIRIREN